MSKIITGYINTVEFQCPECKEAQDAAYDNFEIVGSATAPKATYEYKCTDCGAEFYVDVDLSA